MGNIGTITQLLQYRVMIYQDKRIISKTVRILVRNEPLLKKFFIHRSITTELFNKKNVQSKLPYYSPRHFFLLIESQTYFLTGVCSIKET